MHKIIMLSFFIAVISFSCGGATSGGTSNSGKGTMSCVIDGTPVSIAVQNGFFPIVLDPQSKGPTDGLELMDGSAKKEGFQFEIKDHGTTNIRGGADNILCIITYFDKAGSTFVGTDVTVTISTASTDHLTGTFSGKFKKTVGDKKITITDGKFDLTR